MTRKKSTAGLPVIFDTDCEGPTVANDNAMEVSELVIDNGSRFFEQLSRFDDITAYSRKRYGSNAGDTLRLLLPFLKAYDLTDERFQAWVHRRNGVKWIRGVKKTMDFAREQRLPVYEISASYRPFAQLVAERLLIPVDNLYCTDFGLNRYEMSKSERGRVREIASEIVDLPTLPEIALNSRCEVINATSFSTLDSFERMENLLWGEMATDLPCSGLLLKDTIVMGGREKARAIEESVWREKLAIENVMYVGDSITDVEAFKTVTAGHGIAVSFNGNRFAVEASEIVTWGTSSLVNALVLGVFKEDGWDGVTKFAASGGEERLVRGSSLRTILASLEKDEWGISIQGDDAERAVRLSEIFRLKTRGAATSRLS